MNETESSRKSLICQKCRFLWKARIANPKKCPRCHCDWRTGYKYGVDGKKYWMNEAPIKAVSK